MKRLYMTPTPDDVDFVKSLIKSSNCYYLSAHLSRLYSGVQSGYYRSYYKYNDEVRTYTKRLIDCALSEITANNEFHNHVKYSQLSYF